MSLSGQVALVTGASRGIGREIACSLAVQGAKVVVNYNGNEKKAAEVVEEIKSLGGEAISYQCNVSEFEACKNMVAEVVKNFGRIDLLVNNAGITKDGLVLAMKEADFDCVIDTNLKGSFVMCKHVSKVMLKQRSGKIINISSVSGVLGNAGQANYSASKAGVIGLTKALARELASRNITVNAIAPGFIETDMTDALTEAQKTAFCEQILLKRMGSTKDIAQAVLFLAKSDYITGQVLCVDGGMA
ncbi:MAG: 3-oxoacyl-[acyl-carrier-protein] reductase [Lachnospiraceae bacterium]